MASVKVKYKGVPPRSGMNSPTASIHVSEQMVGISPGKTITESLVTSYLKNKYGTTKKLIESGYDIVILEMK